MYTFRNTSVSENNFWHSFLILYNQIASSVRLTGVPFTIVDTLTGSVPSSSITGASRERPKSETLAVSLESSNMLLALISRWNIGG